MAQNYRQMIDRPAGDPVDEQPSPPSGGAPAEAPAPSPAPSTPGPAGDESALGDPGKRALDRQKEIARGWKHRYEEAAAKVQEFENANLTDQERRDRQLQELQQRAERAERDVLVRDIASEYGLTARQARWLHGSNRDEIEQSYEEMLADGLIGAPKPDPAPSQDPPQQSAQPAQQEPARPNTTSTPPPGRPTPKPRGGGNPEEPPDEMDPYKLASGIPRHH